MYVVLLNIDQNSLYWKCIIISRKYISLSWHIQRLFRF